MVACKKLDSMGKDVKILNVNARSGVVLQQSYIYSNSKFEILVRPDKPNRKKQPGASKKQTTFETDFPKAAKDIKPGDRLTNTKIGDNNTILVVVETNETKRLAKSGPWKDQLIVMLTVRPEYPNTDIEEGVTISTGDENTIWLEAAEPDDPSTNSGNDMHIEPKNNVIEIEDAANEDDAMGGYPYDLVASRVDRKAILNGWHFGNDKTRISPEEGGNCECLSGSLTVWPSCNTPTFKGCTPRHPHDPEYSKEDDPREYIAISAVNAGSM